MVGAVGEGTIRLVIVEYEGLYRDLLASVLSNLDGLEVAGSFADGKAAAKAVRSLKPDVAVLDMEQGNQNGIRLALRLRQSFPGLGVVLLSSDRDMGVLSALPDNVLLGWCHLINKSVHDVGTLARAIQAIAAQLLRQRSGDGYSAARSRPVAPSVRLSDRQLEILGLVAQGMSNAAVARSLQLKEKTVENQLASIYEKLEIERERRLCHPRVRAVLWYLAGHPAGHPANHTAGHPAGRELRAS